MKLVRDMNELELLELIGVVSIRVTAFTYAVSATREASRFSHYASSIQAQSSMSQHLDTYTSKAYIMDISYDAVISLVLFLLTVPLARLLCRGLATIRN